MTVQINLLLLLLCRAVASKLLEYEAETLLADKFGYLDYKNLIKWNLKSALSCLVFADLATYDGWTDGRTNQPAN